MEKQDNQQLSLQKLSRITKVGDGYFWKHPESVNYKIIHTSTEPELLELKRSILPELFTEVKLGSRGRAKGVFKNAKPIYTLTSFVHPVFTEYAKKTKQEVIQELTLEDFVLWYLDDGCAVKRNDSGSYRFSISIGDCASTLESKNILEDKIRSIFGNDFGRIYKNNSKASESNKSWIMTKRCALMIIEEGKKYGILSRKFPEL